MTVGRLEGMNDAIDEFPGLKARTLRFTCGAPRSARAIGDGSRALFLRSDGPEETVTSLWMSVIGSDGDTDEILLADPRTLLADADAEDVPAEEKARRERAREGGSGIVGYSVDAAGNRVTSTKYVPVVYMMCRPSGLMRGFSTGLNSGSSMAMPRVTPAAISVRNSWPLMVNVTRLPAASTE